MSDIYDDDSFKKTTRQVGRQVKFIIYIKITFFWNRPKIDPYQTHIKPVPRPNQTHTILDRYRIYIGPVTDPYRI